jgi:hypothetical protein
VLALKIAVRPGKWAPANAISIGYSPFARPHIEMMIGRVRFKLNPSV